ncbi:hypothetical protein WK76_18015 [Burkholderia ubonensis]|nr:hypothetical protein WK76_18015 [Burkholderia ubonensis]
MSQVTPARLSGRLLSYAYGIRYLMNVMRLLDGEFALTLSKLRNARVYTVWEITSKYDTVLRDVAVR